MSEEKAPLKIIFPIVDFQDENNNYNLLQFKSLKKEPIKIDKKIIETTVYLDKETYLEGLIKEEIKLSSEKDEYPPKEYTMNLFSGIDNIFNLNVNDDGDCSLEIIKMWFVDFSDKPSLEERIIPDIKYNGKYNEMYEKLYERKRINILNAKLDYFERDLFSEKTLDYLKKNKNKSYKFDILMNNKNYSYFLSEIVCSGKVNFFDEKEKDKMQNKIESLKSEMEHIMKDMEETENYLDAIQKQKDLHKFLMKNFPDYEKLRKDFEIYNKKWNLDKFSEKDFELFLLFSGLQIYYKNYKDDKDISINIREEIGPKFEKLKNKVIANESINLIDKARIICAFSKFCSKILNKFDLPEFFTVDSLKEDKPFKIALNKFKDIINNLNESSGLFKILLLFDMGSTEIINDWDFKDFEVLNFKYMDENYFSEEMKFMDFKKKFYEYDKNKKNKIKLTFPVISMLTLDQIKKHALILLPKYFYVIPKNYEYNAISCPSYRISFFNESRIVGLSMIENKNKKKTPEPLVLPWMIVISHETYSHLKTHLANIYNESPALNVIQGFRQLMCPNYYENEPGYYLEYFLADDYSELTFLKTRNIDLYPLTDFKYWTDINFNEMKKLTKKYYLPSLSNFPHYEGSYKEFEDLLKYDKRNIDEGKDIRCAFKIFNS